MSKLSSFPLLDVLDGDERFALTKGGANKNVAASTILDLLNPRPADFAVWLQAKVDAGASADWVWGDHVFPAPVTITHGAHLNGWHFDGHGATFTAGYSDTASDMLKFIVPDNVAAGVFGMRLMNFNLDGTGAALPRKAGNGLVLSAKLAQSAIFGGSVTNVGVYGCHLSGLLIYGNCFETDLISILARDNDRHGVELRNPTAGGGTGPISSINIFGGDFRTNGINGLALTADTTFQEPPQAFHAYATNFISNGGEGINMPAGGYVHGCHFENNCGSSGNAAMLVGYSWSVIENCNGGNSNGGQTYLVNYGGAGGHILRSSINLTGVTAHLQGVGTITIDSPIFTDLVAPFADGAISAWAFSTMLASTVPVEVTAATATVDLGLFNSDIICNRAGTVTLTLPPPANCPGQTIDVKTKQAQTVVSATANVVPLIGGSASTAILAATAGKWATLKSNGTAWEIMKAG